MDLKVPGQLTKIFPTGWCEGDPLQVVGGLTPGELTIIKPGHLASGQPAKVTW